MRRKTKHAPIVLKYHSDRPRQVFALALLGATDKQMADVMGIGIDTFDAWKKRKPEFMEALQKGKLEADAKVAQALYHRAIGFEYEEDHVSVFKGDVRVTRVKKVLPPDVTAAVRWLSARQRGLWTDVSKVETVHTNININKFDFQGLTTDELMLVKKLGLKQLSEHVADN